MTVHYDTGKVTVHHGDCLDILTELGDNTIDAVVTDPPYGLEFMGKDWDSFARQDTTASVQRGDAGGFGDDPGKPWNKARSGTRGVRSTFRCRTCSGWSGSFSDARRARQKACECVTPDYDYTGAPATMLAFQAWCTQWAAECLRVLKPGGMLVSFGGTRTFHRLACAIEDAGFEIRDSIGYGHAERPGLLAWVYGSGFPKSRNISKDPQFCQCLVEDSTHGGTEGVDPLEQVGTTDLSGVRQTVPSLTDEAAWGPTAGLFPSVSGHQGSGPAGPGSGARSVGVDGSVVGLIPDEHARGGQPGVEGRGDVQASEGQLHRPEVRPLPTGVPADGTQGRLHHGAPAGDGSVGGSDADPLGVREPHQPRPARQSAGEPRVVPDERGPQARRGWPVCGGCGKPVIPLGLGTALKPSWEPIVVARKPLGGTVAANVQAWGTGALNIDGARVGAETRPVMIRTGTTVVASSVSGESTGATSSGEVTTQGRWPANVALDDTQAAALDQQAGEGVSRIGKPRGADAGDGWGMTATGAEYDDTGGASRFFPTFRYEAKAPTVERPRHNGAAHATVKPLDLMRWLVRLVTAPGGTVLDPFAGTGTTAEACLLEGFRCVTIEREADYLPLIVDRLTRRRDPAAWLRGRAAHDPDVDLGLFGLLEQEDTP